MRRLGKAAVAALAAASLTAVSAGSATAGPVSMVSVPLSAEDTLEQLERTGLDVTHDVSPTDATVILYSAADAARLREAGFTFTTVVSDLQQRNSAERAEEASVAVPTALPSGRTTYRVYEDYVAEMNALAAANPGFVRKVTMGQTLEGRDIVGLEIADEVSGDDDGRPVYLQMGLHHAREWPSGEYPMEFAIDLVNGFNASDTRIVDLLGHVRVFIFPVINVDGFLVSRGAALSPLGDPTSGILAGAGEYRRKNCRPANAAQAAMPCAQRPETSGIDLNRNYGYYWGGPGSSSSLTSESYRGTGPFSEPESEAVHRFVSKLHPTVLITNHTFTNDGKWLRQPGFDAQFMPTTLLPTYAASGCTEGLDGMGAITPDETAMKDLGDDMAAPTGWKSELGYETLCDITGATEDWNYFGQGTYGYTPEARGPDFHSLYPVQVVAEYGDPGTPGVGVRESFLVAGERAADPAHHGIIEGVAPPGATLKLSKDFEAPTFNQPALNVDEHLETTLKAPAGGTYSWHVNPSDRPAVGGGPEPPPAPAPGDETWTMTCQRPGQAGVFTKQVEVTRNQTVNVGWGDSECGAPPADPNLPPVADYTVVPSPPVVNQEAVFTSTSTDSDGAIETTEWDLDGDTVFETTGLVATHTFTTTGDHDVSVKVTDDDGDTNMLTKTLSVAAEPPANVPPIANFDYFPTSPLVFDDVTFTSSSADSDGLLVKYEWDIDGDGQFDDGEGSVVTRGYAEAGVYDVGLRVTDDRGATATKREKVTVSDRGTGAGPRGRGCAGRTATIVGTSGDDRGARAIVGTPGRDVIFGLRGDDVIRGRGGADLICGNRGDDLLRGGAGADFASGGRGSDRVLGGRGRDLLRGGAGADVILGGPGRDRCHYGVGGLRLLGCP